MRSAWRAAGAALLLTCCAHARASLARQPSLDDELELALPPGSPWERVRLERLWFPASASAEGGPDRLELRLTLSKQGNTMQRVLGATTAEAPLALRVATDGHALILQSRRETWQYVGLDAGGEPYLCPHLSFDTLNAERLLVESATPTLAADVLARPEVHPLQGPLATSELDLALRLVGSRASDGLTDTWAAWLLRPDTPAIPAERALLPVQGAGPALGERAPLAQRILLAGLDPGAAPLEKRLLASRALQGSRLAEVQDRLAGLLVAAKPGDDQASRCALRDAEALALARVTASRAQVSEAVKSILARLATSPVGCPGPAGARVPALAILALASLPADGAIHEALEGAARLGCSRPLTPGATTQPERWEPALDGSESLEPGCWARAAIQEGAPAAGR